MQLEFTTQLVKMPQGKGYLDPLRCFVPISEAISEPHLPSKEANHLRPAFVDVKAKSLDRLARCKRVKGGPYYAICMVPRCPYINPVAGRPINKAFFQQSVAWLLGLLGGLVPEDLLSFQIRPAAPFPRRIHNLEHPVGSVLRTPLVDSLNFDDRAFTDISPERSSHPYAPRSTKNLCIPMT
ncbi:hypothetical protein AVEN_147392-1 [Araneus ventricosus]|uniref:Uncharacterized protein n=1 Tax=Araneus ventricosus TaxID=182803 RepID=A0A4Y2FVB7_ARAVE|nr:hypothetical protein AVEN_147392-1 [Araneus ventricosus]